jgi:hypothetical protein
VSKEAFAFNVYRCFDDDLWSCNEPSVMADYAVHRDESRLTMPADVRPTKFRCRALSRDQRRLVDESSSPNSKRMLAFRYGLVEIVDVRGSDDAYTTFVPNRASAKDGLTPDVLDAIESLGFGDVDFWDVGSAIMARSFLARGRRPNCEVPDSSRRECGDNIYHRAGRSKTPLTVKADSSPSASTSDAVEEPQAPTP